MIGNLKGTYKVCKSCCKKLPDSLDFFYKAYEYKGNVILRNKCKMCYSNGKTKYVKLKGKNKKICRTCNKEYLTTTNYFYKNQGKYLQSTCKFCNKKLREKYKK